MENKFEQIIEMQARMMEEYGFIIHSVFPTDENDASYSHHTHGLKENFNHMDLEIALPLPQQLAGQIIHSMVDQIKEGASFEDKLTSDKVIMNYDVHLVRVNEDGREVLRVILPDPEGRFPFDEDCRDIYNRQLDGVEITSMN